MSDTLADIESVDIHDDVWTIVERIVVTDESTPKPPPIKTMMGHEKQAYPR